MQKEYVVDGDDRNRKQKYTLNGAGSNILFKQFVEALSDLKTHRKMKQWSKSRRKRWL